MVNRRQFVTAALATVATACRKKRPTAFNGYAFIANGEGNAISVVDLASFSVAKHISLDGSSTVVIAHPSQPRPKPSVYVLTPASGHVYELHSEDLQVLRRVDLGSPAISMRLSQDASALWVLCADRKLVSVDLDSFRIGSQIGLPGDPHDFDLSNETHLAAISYGPAGSVSQVDLTSRSAGKASKVADEVGIVRFRKDGKSILLANTAGRMLTVLEAPSGQVITHLPLAVRPDNFCFNQNGGQLFITGEGRDAVVVVYPYYVPQVAETVLAGSVPGAMAASSAFLFVANPGSGGVSILNIERRKVISVASVGAEPSFITVTPDDQYVLVLNRQSGDMAVIRTAAIVRDRRKSTALFWMVPVGSKPLSAAVTQVV